MLKNFIKALKTQKPIYRQKTLFIYKWVLCSKPGTITIPTFSMKLAWDFYTVKLNTVKLVIDHKFIQLIKKRFGNVRAK